MSVLFPVSSLEVEDPRAQLHHPNLLSLAPHRPPAKAPHPLRRSMMSPGYRYKSHPLPTSFLVFLHSLLPESYTLPPASVFIGASAGRLYHHNSLQGPGAAGGGPRLCASEWQHTWGSGLHAAVTLPTSRLHWTGHGEAPERAGWAQDVGGAILMCVCSVEKKLRLWFKFSPVG